MDRAYESELTKGLEKKFRKLEEDIMTDVVRRIQKTRKITSAADWQLQRYAILGNSTYDVENIVKKATGGSFPEVFELYDKVIEEQYTRSKALYEQVNQTFIPYDQNVELQQLASALVKQSNDDLFNISRSMGFMIDLGVGGNRQLTFTPLSEIYNEYIDQAVVNVASGAFDYNTMIRKVVGQLTNSGLRTVDYASGHSNRVDVAARRAVLTGVSQLSGRITDMNAAALGTDKYEVSWHFGARPEHSVWQGRVYTYDELVEVCGLGEGPGLLGWNCYHMYYPFIEGVSERQYSDEWLDEMNEKEAETTEFRGREYNTYEATQRQRYLETNMRAQREKAQLLKVGGASKEDVLVARCKYQAMLEEYKAFSAKMKLPEQMERVYYDLRGRIAPSKKTYETWKAEREDKYQRWIREIGAAGSAPKTLAAYEQEKYNKTREYQLLKGYARAVQKGDIHALTGFDLYKQTAEKIDRQLIGVETPSGVAIDSYATHFIDRVIGQTAESHTGMRQGVPIEVVRDALLHPESAGKIRMLQDGDQRQTVSGKLAKVVYSLRDRRLIQTNPWGAR